MEYMQNSMELEVFLNFSILGNEVGREYGYPETGREMIQKLWYESLGQSCKGIIRKSNILGQENL